MSDTLPRMDESDAARRVAARHMANEGQIRATFDQLGLGPGYDFDDAIRFVQATLDGLRDGGHRITDGAIVGIACAFTVICVEIDRDAVGDAP